jgi:hypothetical protein
VTAAWSWPPKAALFPLVTGVPLLALALVQLALQLRAPELPVTRDRRRTLLTFGWMAAFVLLVFLAGFPSAIPLFVFAYLLVQGAAGWLRATVLAAAAWSAFHVLFERVLRLSFDGGLLGGWLGS